MAILSSHRNLHIGFTLFSFRITEAVNQVQYKIMFSRPLKCLVFKLGFIFYYVLCSGLLNRHSHDMRMLVIGNGIWQHLCLSFNQIIVFLNALHWEMIQDQEVKWFHCYIKLYSFKSDTFFARCDSTLLCRWLNTGPRSSNVCCDL